MANVQILERHLADCAPTLLMLAGVVLHLAESHGHEHEHGVMEHEHASTATTMATMTMCMSLCRPERTAAGIVMHPSVMCIRTYRMRTTRTATEAAR